MKTKYIAAVLITDVHEKATLIASITDYKYRINEVRSVCKWLKWEDAQLAEQLLNTIPELKKKQLVLEDELKVLK